MAGIEKFSVRMMLVGANVNNSEKKVSFVSGEKEINCEIVNDKVLKDLVGPILEDDIDKLTNDVLAICLLTYQKVTVDQFKKLREDIGNKKGHYKFDGNKMLLFCNLEC